MVRILRLMDWQLVAIPRSKERIWLRRAAAFGLLAVLALSQVRPTKANGPNQVTLVPPLRLAGSTYLVTYEAGGSYRDADARLLVFSAAELKERDVRQLVITRGGRAVRDRDELERVLTAYQAAVYLYRFGPDTSLGSIPDDFVDTLHRVTNNPFFLKQIVAAQLKGRELETADAFLAILTPQVASDPARDFGEAMVTGLRNGKRGWDAADDALALAKVTGNPTVRTVYKDATDAFGDWTQLGDAVEPTLDIGTGIELELVNGLDLVRLGLEVFFVAPLSAERADWLRTYADSHPSGAGAFDTAQRRAGALAASEAHDINLHRHEIVREFAREELVDISAGAGRQVISRAFMDWTTARSGEAVANHALAWASAAGLGLTLGGLLYGLDDVYDNFRVAERCNEIREHVYVARLDLQNAVRTPSSKAFYNGELAEAYRQAYMLEALSAAQAHRSYADGVAATYNKGWLEKLNPLSWLKGREWSAAVDELRTLAANEERQAEDAIGHPANLAFLVSLAADTSPELPLPTPDEEGRTDVDRAISAIGRLLRGAGRVVADGLRRASEEVSRVIRRDAPASPEQVAAAYLDAVERMDTGSAVKHVNPRDRLGMRLAHGAMFAMARGLGVTFSFEGLTYTLEASTPETASVRIQGQVDIRWELLGETTQTREALDERLPLVLSEGEWYVKGSEELNTVLRDLTILLGDS